MQVAQGGATVFEPSDIDWDWKPPSRHAIGQHRTYIDRAKHEPPRIASTALLPVLILKTLRRCSATCMPVLKDDPKSLFVASYKVKYVSSQQYVMRIASRTLIFSTFASDRPYTSHTRVSRSHHKVLCSSVTLIFSRFRRDVMCTEDTVLSEAL